MYTSPSAIKTRMFRAIGTVIVLYAVTQMFVNATTAFEEAAVATFKFVTATAETSTTVMEAHVAP